MLVWRNAARLPSVMVTTETATSRATHCTCARPKATMKTRIMIAKPVAFEAVERNAVIGVGRALVGVGRPLMERHQAGLEPKPS